MNGSDVRAFRDLIHIPGRLFNLQNTPAIWQEGRSLFKEKKKKKENGGIQKFVKLVRRDWLEL